MNHLSNLVTLNLSNNLIKKVEGLKGLDQLMNLDLSKNYFENVADLEELTELPSLSSLDLRNNQIEGKEEVL